MNLDKLKDTARRHELREEWRKAIEIYQRALHDVAKEGEPADPSLYNRIGDLELKAGEIAAALHAYEQAADTYTEQGFFNNAIALCGKILRVNPGRTATFLRLADLHARKNVLGESRRNLSEYLERMLAASQHDQLAVALKGFVERFAGGAEYRAMIAEVLRNAGRTEKARGFCDHLVAELGLDDERAHRRPRRSGHGDASAGPTGLIFLDTGVDIPGILMGGPPASADPASDADSDPGVSGDSFAVAMEAEAPPDVNLLPFVEPTAVGGGLDELGSSLFDLSGFEPTRLVTEVLRPDPTDPLVIEERPEPITITGLEPLPEFSAPVTGDLGFEPMPLDDDLLPVLDDSPLEPSLEPLFDELSVDDDERRISAGASVADLDAAFDNAVADERWQEALSYLVRLIRLEPEVVARHQKRVEIAYRSGSREYLIDAYLSLAQALERIGATENAGLVFRRVLEHDPENPMALAGLAGLGWSGRVAAPDQAAATVDAAPVAAEPAAPAGRSDPTGPGERNGDSFVDLGALILDPEPEKDTRMRVDQGEPESEQDVDFRETLAQFRQGVEANIDAGDFQAHYDLGIAFKEMGLLDEAIAQFQKALRAPDGRLRSSEALGIAFFEKGRHAIAEAVLSRAVESLPEADDAKIALIYWWGRALEAQGKTEPAIRCYERALAVDITFLDLGDRLQRLNAERP